MDHRIRVSLGMGTAQQTVRPVEADETFIGGKARNMHDVETGAKITGTGGKDKTAVMGILERGEGSAPEGSYVVIPNRKKKAIQSGSERARGGRSAHLYRRPEIVRGAGRIRSMR